MQKGASRLPVPATSLQGQAQDRTGFCRRKSAVGDGRRARKPQEHFDPMKPSYLNTPLNEQRHFFAAIDAALAPTSWANAEEGRSIGRGHSADTSQMRAAPGVRCRSGEVQEAALLRRRGIG
jgi:hypothetical protein